LGAISVLLGSRMGRGSPGRAQVFHRPSREPDKGTYFRIVKWPLSILFSEVDGTKPANMFAEPGN
jgi:hypothetical protein